MNGDSKSPARRAIKALQRIEAARQTEETARRQQQEEWGQLQDALSELKSSSPSIQGLPMELLQAGLGVLDSESAPPLVVLPDDGAGGDVHDSRARPGDNHLERAEHVSAWPDETDDDPSGPDEHSPSEWDMSPETGTLPPGTGTLPPELKDPIAGEGDEEAFWDGIVLDTEDDDVEGTTPDPFLVSE